MKISSYVHVFDVCSHGWSYFTCLQASKFAQPKVPFDHSLGGAILDGIMQTDHAASRVIQSGSSVEWYCHWMWVQPSLTISFLCLQLRRRVGLCRRTRVLTASRWWGHTQRVSFLFLVGTKSVGRGHRGPWSGSYQKLLPAPPWGHSTCLKLEEKTNNW